MAYCIELLNKNNHDRQGFSCGEPSLDTYIQRFAAQNYRRGVATTHVLIDSSAATRDRGKRTILGFYALSAAQLHLSNLAATDRQKLPKYPVPAVRMGQLAVATTQRGQGIGELLLADAVKRSLRARETHLGAVVMIVEALDTQAAAFYRHFGFTPCARYPQTLYYFLGKA